LETVEKNKIAWKREKVRGGRSGIGVGRNGVT